jgi:hypothetical protein
LYDGKKLLILNSVLALLNNHDKNFGEEITSKEHFASRQPIGGTMQSCFLSYKG